jgi:hypothetical protein
MNDPGGNSVAAANFVAVFIGAPDVDFSGTSHFGLRDRKLFDSRAAKSSWTEVQCRAVMSASGQSDIRVAKRHVRFTTESGH